MTTKKKFTLKGVQAELRTMNLILTKRDGEYRVNFRGGHEDSAAYDDDLEAIRGTALAMYRWQAGQDR